VNIQVSKNSAETNLKLCMRFNSSSSSLNATVNNYY